MSTKGKLTRRDLPSMFILFGLASVMFAMIMSFVATKAIEKDSDLQPISGIVESVDEEHLFRFGPKLRIVIHDGSRLYSLTQDHLAYLAPGTLNLQRGSRITARVNQDLISRDLKWIWELKQNGNTILSYEDTSNYFKNSNEKDYKIARYAVAISFGLFILGVILRLFFGVWKDPN